MLISNLCHYSDANIVANGKIVFLVSPSKKVIKLNNPLIKITDERRMVLPMCNFLECN